MNEQQIRWDDLQIVSAIADTGTLSGAGRRLGISHATVFRRLTNLENQLGVVLFERSRTGYTPSAAGEDLFAVARRVQADITGVERRLAGKDLKLSGTLRVTTTDTLFAGLLATPFEKFRADYPDIKLEVVISNQVHSLSKREADIAIRPTGKPPETLVGRRVGVIRQSVYGQRHHWQHERVPLDTLTGHQWIGPDNHMGNRALETWMARKGLNEFCNYRVDSMLGMQTAAQSGAAVAVLPDYLGNSDPELCRLTDPIEELDIPLWILTHPDLKRVKRIRAFTQVIGEELRQALVNAPV
ncbi:LysR family transcriptional regulator [Marinobacter guineae]|uniref:LysR family transcriptional regulator n=1 Tax=Marinobacter guineae TaxID=432303 RepID=A0A2G1VB70_9GAMM|nr:LysR family transcriptional regulator [Marinobacter guineae]PHQ24023.1 LysR family transcriptional regulator [Marinobacter guineae]